MECIVWGFHLKVKDMQVSIFFHVTVYITSLHWILE